MILDQNNEEDIRQLLLGHKVVKVEQSLKDHNQTGVLELDNGTILEVYPNIGCAGCECGNYFIEELNNCDNIITRVDITNDDEETVFNIFVYAENQQVNLLQVEGQDNGYYGTGYKINVTLPQP